jgi:hypothetical protein
MESAKKSKAFAWLMFLVFSVITIGMLIMVPEWFWVPLPFMLTYFVQAMDVM